MQLRTSNVTIANRDLDTGQRTRPGGYSLTDETYERLLKKITDKPERGIPLGLKQDIEAYYADPNAPIRIQEGSGGVGQGTGGAGGDRKHEDPRAGHGSGRCASGPGTSRLL